MHPLAAPGTLWVLSRVGKYLVRPQAGETSHEKQIPCGRQETGLPFFSPHRKGFRLCGGDQGAFRSPPGPLRGPSLYTWTKPPTRNRFLVEGRKRAYLSFPVSQRVSPLRRRPGGFPVRPLDSFGGGQKLCHDAVLAGCESKGFTFTWAYKKRARFSAAYGCGRSFRSGHALFIAFSKSPDGTAPAWGKSPTSPPASAG